MRIALFAAALCILGSGCLDFSDSDDRGPQGSMEGQLVASTTAAQKQDFQDAVRAIEVNDFSSSIYNLRFELSRLDHCEEVRAALDAKAYVQSISQCVIE